MLIYGPDYASEPIASLEFVDQILFLASRTECPWFQIMYII